jgi:hypothetical protein
MKTLLVGDCQPDHVFVQSDPDAPSEVQFENDVARALACLYPKHRCIPFTGSFRGEDGCYQPDLALVAKDLSHWFVIEVELLSHSLEYHVLPQVRAFHGGDPQADCVSQLASRLPLDVGTAQSLVQFVPRAVAVVANKSDFGWLKAFQALSVQMLTVSVYRSRHDVVAVEIDGVLEAIAEHLGFGRYSATDRSLRFPKDVRIPAGMVQIFDPGGVLSSWIVSPAADSLWVTKEVGVPNIAHGALIQLIRTAEGRLSLRRPIL